MAMNMLKTKAKSPTHAIFGRDIEGNVFSMELAVGPHWIVAGQSGSGKSVYVNSLLASMMFHAVPMKELIIMAIDPKQVEFHRYKGLPFCPIDPVTDMSDAYGLLTYLVYEMEVRYNRLKRVGLQKITEFNDWVEENPEQAKAMNYEKLPYIVCVIDEYADMVMQDDSVEGLIVRLAQKARAAGITVLIATQRPSADIISSTIKANVPARIGLKVTDSNNSTIVIGQEGLEMLKGNGDSIIMTTEGDLIRVQGPFIRPAEFDMMFNQIKQRYGVAEPFDYKQLVVDLSADGTFEKMKIGADGVTVNMEWAEEYDDDVPYEDRHLKKVRGRRR